MTDKDETAPEETREEAEAEETREPAVTDEDWERRILCSDGNCIGVIGPDGRCKECGKPYEGELPVDFDAAADPPGEEPEEAEEEGETAGADAAPLEAEDTPEDAPAGSRDDWENRVLCSDGNCIGVIGPDGRCKECGKPYEGE